MQFQQYARRVNCILMSFTSCVFMFQVFSVFCLFCLCFCLRNDLYCVGWGVKLYQLNSPFVCALLHCVQCMCCYQFA